MPQKTFTLAAALLMSFTVWVHVVPGGADVHEPLIALTMPESLRAITSVIWHAVTVVLMVIAVATFWLWRAPNAALEFALAAIQLGFAGLFLFYGVRDLGEVVSMPQWSVFVMVPLLTRLGQRNR